MALVCLPPPHPTVIFIYLFPPVICCSPPTTTIPVLSRPSREHCWRSFLPVSGRQSSDQPSTWEICSTPLRNLTWPLLPTCTGGPPIYHYAAPFPELFFKGMLQSRCPVASISAGIRVAISGSPNLIKPVNIIQRGPLLLVSTLGFSFRSLTYRLTPCVWTKACLENQWVMSEWLGLLNWVSSELILHDVHQVFNLLKG